MKIKEGGVMDIHELRQFESVYKPSNEVAFCWLRKQYVQLSTEENHTEIVDHANDSLRIWQAAKAQAVPKDSVVVSKWTLALALNSIENNEDNEGIIEDLQELIHKAQEPAND